TNLAGGDYSKVSEDVADTGGWGVLTLADRLLSDDDRLGRWYLGGAIFALAVVAPFIAWRRFATPFFVGLSLVTMILTLHEWPVHHLFYLLPRFRQLHQHLPDHILTVFYIGPALLAGATVSAFRDVSSRWKATILALAPIAVAGVIDNRLRATAPPLDSSNGPHHIPAKTLVSIAAVSLLLLLLVWVRPLRLRMIATVALVLVVFLDPTGRLVLGRLDGDPHDAEWSATVDGYTSASGAAVFLQQRQAESSEPFRFFGYDPRPTLVESGPGRRTYVSEYRDPNVMALLVNNQAILLGLDDVQGYNPVQLSLYSTVIHAVNVRDQGYHTANILGSGWNSPVLALLNVRYLVIPSQVPPGRPDLLHLSQRCRTVYADERVRVVEVDDALPRAWIVHDLRKVKRATILPSLRKREFDPRQTALLSSNPPETAPPADPAQDRATVVGYQPERITLTTSTGAAGLLVLSEIDHPDWHAYVDGKPVGIYQTDRVLRGVPIPAGDHVVELRYDQPSLRLGLLASAATALVVALVVLALGLQHRRSHPQPVGP
ncbi:MAG TPA: YfhO family protein, partial [Thermomicrobiales bacterium]